MNPGMLVVIMFWWAQEKVAIQYTLYLETCQATFKAKDVLWTYYPDVEDEVSGDFTWMDRLVLGALQGCHELNGFPEIQIQESRRNAVKNVSTIH